MQPGTEALLKRLFSGSVHAGYTSPKIHFWHGDSTGVMYLCRGKGVYTNLKATHHTNGKALSHTNRRAT